LNLSPARAEVAHLSWFQDVLLKRLHAPGLVMMMLCVSFFVFCILFLCLCVLLFSCPPCWLYFQGPPPPRSILALSHLAHPSCPTLAVPPLLPCPVQPSSSSYSSSLLPRKQPSPHALKTTGPGKGSKATHGGIRAGE